MAIPTAARETHDAMAHLTNTSLWREACFIAGRWVPISGPSIAVDNPASGAAIGHVPRLGRAETREAVAAAKAALPAWRSLLAKERAVLLRRWFNLILTNQEDLARLTTLEVKYLCLAI
jgi:succinate-semialdehyde dehydrogenase/glutarate-semialdehyde dehydrogenase